MTRNIRLHSRNAFIIVGRVRPVRFGQKFRTAFFPKTNGIPSFQKRELTVRLRGTVVIGRSRTCRAAPRRAAPRRTTPRFALPRLALPRHADPRPRRAAPALMRLWASRVPLAVPSQPPPPPPLFPVPKFFSSLLHAPRAAFERSLLRRGSAGTGGKGRGGEAGGRREENEEEADADANADADGPGGGGGVRKA